MKKKISVRNKRGAISLFVLLSLLFFLVLVTGVATSFKNKETTVNSQIAKVKSSYERDLGNEEQVYAKKIKELEKDLYKELVVDPNGGTWGERLTSKTIINKKEGENVVIDAPTPPTVILDLDGGILENEVDTISFVNWQLNGSGTFNENTYTFGDGNGTLTARYTKSSITIPNITKTGYTFKGWYDEKNIKVENPQNYTPIGTVKLKANWIEKQHKTVELAFKDAVGEKYGTPKTLELYDNETGTVTAPEIAEYSGWNKNKYWTLSKEPTGEKAVDSNGTISNVSENATYYAIYQKDIEVTFDVNGAKGNAPQTEKGTIAVNSYNLNNSTTMQVTLPSGTELTKLGYEFAGWKSSTDNQIYQPGNQITTSVDTTFVAEWTQTAFTVTFNGNGGTPSKESILVEENSEIGTLPTATRENYIFDGWFTEASGGTSITENTKVTSDITYYAHWTEATAEVNGTYYTSLQGAISTVPETNVETTVRLLKDTSETITISKNKKIILDLKGNTLSNSGVLKNDGTITILNGTITYTGKSKVNVVQNNSTGNITIGEGGILFQNSTSGGRVVDNKGTLTINGGTIKTISTSEQAIDNASSGTVTMSGGNITVNGTRHGIKNNGGKIYISGGNIYSESRIRAPVNNVGDNGIVEITGGTIISNPNGSTSDAGGYAVYIEKGVCTIGTKGGTPDTTSPVIQGTVYGVCTNVNISFFDGIIKGGKEAITDSSKVTEREPGYFVKYGEESETNYKTAYLERGKIVTFNPTGGQVAESIRGIEEGKVVEKLPEPTRNGYLFKGWYTLADGGDEVTENTIITEDITFYAHWAKAVKITFNPNGGNIINGTKIVEEGTAIGKLPIATKAGFKSVGWFTSKDGGEQITAETKVGNKDITYYVHWKNIYSASIGETQYNTLQEAVNQAPTDGTETTINIIQDTTEKVEIKEGQNIVFNLQNYMISNNGNNNVIENRGTITFRSGSIDSIDAKASTINNYSTGKVIVDGVDIVATGERQAIYNDGGTVIIQGNSTIKSNTNGNSTNDTGGLPRGTIQNFRKGTTIIKSGTIIATETYAIVNSSNSTVTIGEKDGSVDINSPIIKGESYGVKNVGILNFYDGTIKGIKGAVEGNITDKEVGTQEVNGTEVIDSKTYKTLYLSSSSSTTSNVGQNGTLSQNNTQSNKLSIPSRVTNTLGNLVATKKSRTFTIIIIMAIISFALVLFYKKKKK